MVVCPGAWAGACGPGIPECAWGDGGGYPGGIGGKFGRHDWCRAWLTTSLVSLLSVPPASSSSSSWAVGRYEAVQRRVQVPDVGLCEQHPLAEGHGVAVAERVSAVARERHQAAPSENVGLGGDLFFQQLLGGHPPRAAHDDPRLGVARGRVQRPGDTEVDHPRPGQGQQHVGGFQVAVDQTGLVDRGERRGHPQCETVQGARVERTVLGDVLGEGRARNVLGDHVRPVLEGAVVEHLSRAEGGDFAGVFHLVAETRPGGLVESEFGADDLDRYMGSLLRGAAQVDRPHASAA